MKLVMGYDCEPGAFSRLTDDQSPFPAGRLELEFETALLTVFKDGRTKVLLLGFRTAENVMGGLVEST